MAWVLSYSPNEIKQTASEWSASQVKTFIPNSPTGTWFKREVFVMLMLIYEKKVVKKITYLALFKICPQWGTQCIYIWNKVPYSLVIHGESAYVISIAMKVIMISHASCRVCSLNHQATFWVLTIKQENSWNEINVFTFVYLQNQNNENNPDPRIRVIFYTPKGPYCSLSVTHNKRT